MVHGAEALAEYQPRCICQISGESAKLPPAGLSTGGDFRTFFQNSPNTGNGFLGSLKKNVFIKGGYKPRYKPHSKGALGMYTRSPYKLFVSALGNLQAHVF